MGVWDDLKQRLVVQYASEGVVRTSTSQDLDRFEQESGFRLPEDYREYATSFGPGTLHYEWQIAAPGFAKSNKGHSDLGTLYRWIRDAYPGFVAFCGKHDYHGSFAWDPKDVTDPVARDYGVCLLGGPSGEYPDTPPIRVASSFREFVLSYILGGGFVRQQAEYGYADPGKANLSGPVMFNQVP